MQRKLPRPPPRERRGGIDRRRIDAEPPTRHERRLGVEARKPEVIEIILSESEWQAFDPATRKTK